MVPKSGVEESAKGAEQAQDQGFAAYSACSAVRKRRWAKVREPETSLPVAGLADKLAGL